MTTPQTKRIEAAINKEIEAISAFVTKQFDEALAFLQRQFEELNEVDDDCFLDQMARQQKDLEAFLVAQRRAADEFIEEQRRVFQESSYN